MKKVSRFQFRIKAFKKVFICNILFIFIMVCTLILMSIWYTGEKLSEEEINSIENRLYLCAEGIEMQLDNIYQIVYEVACLPSFRIGYIMENKYREIELLEQLEEYRLYGSFFEDVLVMYNCVDKVFSSKGFASPFHIYYDREFGTEGLETLRELLACYSVESSECIEFYRAGNDMLFIFPFSSYSNSSFGNEGVLCFLTCKENILEYVYQMTGRLEGKITIYYNDFCILGEETEQNKKVMCVTSDAKNVKIYFQPLEKELFSLDKVFDLRAMFVFGAEIILMFFVGYVGACFHFRPIRNICNKYSMTSEYDLEPSWKSIDELLEALMNNRNRSNELLKRHTYVIKERLIQSIVKGEYDAYIQRNLMLLNINIEAPFFGIIEIVMLGGYSIADVFQAHYEDIELLSGEDIVFYPCMIDERTIGVLVLLQEQNMYEEALELLSAYFDTQTYVVRIERKGVFRELEEIVGSCGRNKTRNDVKKEKENEKITDDATIENSKIKVIMKYVEENYTDYRLTLDFLAQEFGYSAAYLSRAIKQQTGENYKEFLIELRNKKAKELLENQDFSVTEISQMVGYTSVPHFIKMFQRCNGISPTKYREMSKGHFS